MAIRAPDGANKTIPIIRTACFLVVVTVYGIPSHPIRPKLQHKAIIMPIKCYIFSILDEFSIKIERCVHTKWGGGGMRSLYLETGGIAPTGTSPNPDQPPLAIYLTSVPNRKLLEACPTKHKIG